MVSQPRLALSRFRPIDWLMSGYALVFAGVALTRLGHPGTGWIALAHLLIPVLALLTTSDDLGRAGRVLRDIYPLLLLLGLYGALDVLSGAGSVTAHDATVQRWEEALFGRQVSRWWWQEHPSRFWSAVLHASYFAYYVIVPAPAILFALRRQADELRWYVLAVMATFIVCYLFFIYFPVAGPYYEFPRPASWFTENGPARLVYQVLATGSSYGAAFPSAHVAATITGTVAAWRGSPRFGLVLAVPATLLTVAVVYCQMHYAVDAIAGIAVAGLVLWTTARYSR
jgi:hypothetical protein